AEFTKILSRVAVDPRDFALVAFGGAGPVGGVLLPREGGIPTGFVPPSPGTACAPGAISAAIVDDAVPSRGGRAPGRRRRGGARRAAKGLGGGGRAPLPRMPPTAIWATAGGAFAPPPPHQLHLGDSGEAFDVAALRSDYEALREELGDWLERYGAGSGPPTF